MEIIRAQGIRKSFGNLEVLKGVDFHADKGEIVSVTGASGAGKSTLLQILGTLMSPDGGKLEIGGTDVFSLGSRELAAFRNREIGFVFQFHHLLPEFTALENVMIPAMIGHRSRKDAGNAALRLLETVGLSERTDHKPSELSGGEQQRVAIARALVNNPAIVFADEPTGNLDPDRSLEIMMLLEKINQLGTTMLVVTHEKSLVDHFAKRVITIENGTITSDGTGGYYNHEAT